MTHLTVATDLVGRAAGVLARIEADIGAANAAATPTMELAPAGADEVSTAVAALFGGYGRTCQAISAEAAAFHRRFVQAMTASAESYAGVEVASASLLRTVGQDVLGVVGAPIRALSGCPLFGTGVTGLGGLGHGKGAAIGAAAAGLTGANRGTTGGSGGGHGGTGLGGTSAATVGNGTGNAGSSGGTNASAPLDVVPTGTSGTGGIALVMGPTGIPQPSAGYVATVERLYLAPLGFHGHAESLFTPELGYNTDANLPTDVADLMAAINAQMATGQVSAQNPIWVFGYSQSAAAASAAMVQLHAQGVPAGDLHFVLVGDPAAAPGGSSGGILNTLLPSLGPLGDLIKPLLPWFDLSQTMGLTTPNYYPTDVYTLAGDGYAAWPTNFLSNPIADISAISGLFSTHEEYLGLSPGQIQGATPTHTDGLVQYYTIDNDISQLLPTLINAAVNVGWISPATGEILDWLF